MKYFYLLVGAWLDVGSTLLEDSMGTDGMDDAGTKDGAGTPEEDTDDVVVDIGTKLQDLLLSLQQQVYP